jgi:hypothetical protein
MSSHTVKDLEEFLWASRIHRDNGVVSCDESIGHMKNWMSERGYATTDVPIKDRIDEALADPTMPPGLRQGILNYLREVRSIIYVLGREGVEDAGEWKVEWQDDEGEIHKEKFTAKQDAIDFVVDHAQLIDEDASWTVKTSSMQWDPEYQQEVKVVHHCTLDEVKEYSKRTTFTVTNYLDNYTVECARDDVEEHVQNAINSALRHKVQKFNVYSRVKPVGDEVWGNWWKRIRISPNHYINNNNK